MSKAEKTASRIKRLERHKAALDQIVRTGNTLREAQSRKIAQLQQQNRAMRKGWRGPWRRFKAWRRARR